MKNVLFVITVILCNLSGFTQMSGNRVYQNMDDYRNNRDYATATYFRVQPSVVIDRDSVMFVNATVLLNARADFYVLVLGANQTGKTSEQAMKGLNERIQRCTTKLKEAINLKKEDIYIDFISQTRIFDYDVKTNNNEITASQKQMGFQTKKNIIVKFKNLEDMDVLIEKAAEEYIYDVIKVDYIITDVVKLHQQMLEEASRIEKEKKAFYLKNSNFDLMSYFNVQTDNFYSLYPAKQYQTYQAFETSSVENKSYYDSRVSFTKKDMLMDKTFFYEGEDPSKFDKVMNPGTPQVGVQFVLQYTMKYLIKKK
jgi:uncharacterized protein YggE